MTRLRNEQGLLNCVNQAWSLTQHTTCFLAAFDSGLYSAPVGAEIGFMMDFFFYRTHLFS